MKTTLLFLSVFLSVISYSQPTISELLKLSKSDGDSFEIYALEKGYKFKKIQNDEPCKHIVYAKIDYDKRLARWLMLHSACYGFNQEVSFESDDNSFLINIYKELKVLGFKLNDTEYTDDNVIKSYSRGNEKLKVYVGKQSSILVRVD